MQDTTTNPPKPSQPYVSLCVIFRDNKDTFPDFLASVAGHFDEYIFTDTGSVDGSRTLIETFLKDHRGKVTDFVWCDDFGKARQACFDHATGRWQMFLDTDDKLIRGEALRGFLLQLEAKAPEKEACFIEYDYDVTEVLPTMRLVRMREGWQWCDAIHERLEFKPYALPEEAFFRTSAISVWHKRKTKEEKAAAIVRNAKIARREYDGSTEPKYRARLARTLAMEAKMAGRWDEVIPLNEELYKLYAVYPEGRQGAADLAKAYLSKGLALKDEGEQRRLFDIGLEWGKKAGPAYEGIILNAQGRWEEVLGAASRSKGIPQQTTHEGVLFEKAGIYIAAAEAALNLKVPRAADVADNLINHIPPKLKLADGVSVSLGPIRGMVDRITIVVPGTPQPFDEKGGAGMLGGSEEAVVYLSRALAQMGRNVRIYGVLPPARLPGPDAYGVDWQPVESFNMEAEIGCLVIWRAPALAINIATARQNQGKILSGITRAFLWLHDSGLGLSPEHAAIAGKCVEGAVVLSDFHAKMVKKNGYTGELFKLSNGIVRDQFEPWIDGSEFSWEKRDQNRVIYSSCPSRGLVPLLEMWPEIKAECPKAYLDIYYDWSMLEMMQPNLYDRVIGAYEKVKHLDVKHHGGVGHLELHEALRGCNVWAYSHFESPEVETSCISLVKAMAAGATALTVPNGALKETAGGDANFATNTEEYKSRLIQFLKQPVDIATRRLIAKRTVERFAWDEVAKGFSKLWTVHKEPPKVETKE